MYNILVFGLDGLFDQLKKEFDPASCRRLHVDASRDFYSIAFSRVFDAWLIDATHPDLQELAMDELLAPRAVPAIIVVGARTIPSNWPGRCHLMPEEDTLQIRQLFSQLMANRQEQSRERYLAGYLDKTPRLDAIVTKSPLMRNLVDLVKDVAPTDSPVFLIGETGTGKELLAHIFHNESRRKSGPFMAVNCGALPDTLLESELFGYEKGAFTNADHRRIGKIEHATGGTLFLDEVEAMTPAMQIRLLRVLQERTFQRLGSNQDITADFRVIAATNADPSELLNAGHLRSDLYYRLSVFQVNIPALRDRVEDIPLLVQHFINRKKKNGREYVKGLDSQAMNLLLSVPWFGNVRELQNVIERAVMLAASDMISVDLIQIPGMPADDAAAESAGLTDSAFRPGTTLKKFKNRLSQTAERKYLAELLTYTGGRIGEAAQLAGLTPRALYNRMKIHGLRKEDFKKVR